MRKKSKPDISTLVQGIRSISLEAHADTFILINQALDDAFQNCDEPDLEAVATLAMMLGDRLRCLEEGPRRLAVVVETLNHMIEYAMQGDPRFDDFFRQWRAKPVHQAR